MDSIGDGENDKVSFKIMACTSSHQNLIDFVFPPQVLTQPLMCLKRAILVPTNKQVNKYNNIILRQLDGDKRSYFTADTLKEVNNSNLTSSTSILNYITQHPPPGMPAHKIDFKENTVFCLLHNFSINGGLVKNAKVVIKGMGQHLISVQLHNKKWMIQMTYESLKLHSTQYYPPVTHFFANSFLSAPHMQPHSTVVKE